MKPIEKRRMNISMSEDNRNSFNNILRYFLSQNSTESLNHSNVANKVFSIFEDLFIKESSTDNLIDRLDQLKKIENSSPSGIKNQLTILKYQNDLLTYILLAVSQKMDLSSKVEWKPEYLQSIYTGTDPEQNKMLKKAAELVQKDRARGQTIKSTNSTKKNAR